MNSSKIEVSNIWIEDLFEWFLIHVIDSGGDGCGYIVCENYKEAARYFLDWYKEKYRKDFWHLWDEYEYCVNFHDTNENFIFTNNLNIKSFDGDYMFVVKQDCRFSNQYPHSSYLLKAVNS